VSGPARSRSPLPLVHERPTEPLSPREVDSLRGRSVHVVGISGTEGAAVTRFLWRRGVRDLTVHDLSDAREVEANFSQQHVGMPKAERRAFWAELASLPIRRRLGQDYLGGVEEADVLFVGQAWYLYPSNMEVLGPLASAGKPFYNIMHLYFGLCRAPIVAVTGSLGKSTTSRMVEHILRAAGQKVLYAGNERRSVQVLELVEAAMPDQRLVLEVSNRHLLAIRPRPWIGAVTNVLPNHLDEHGGDLASYAKTKQRLIASQGRGDFAVLNAADPLQRSWQAAPEGTVLWFDPSESGTGLGPDLQPSPGAAREGNGAPEPNAWLEEGRVVLRMPRDGTTVDVGAIDPIAMPGRHNLVNAMAASLVAATADAEPGAISRALTTFRGLRHRLQFVWGADGVAYYDDLNATSPLATVAALEALGEGPLVLIAGGDDKGLDFTPLARAIIERVRWLVLLPGPGTERLEAAVRRASEGTVRGPRVERYDDFSDAVRRVWIESQPGDRVLLSPACPYFFRRNYLASGRSGGEELGFRALLRQLSNDVAARSTVRGGHK